jgi:hypothetical protein
VCLIYHFKLTCYFSASYLTLYRSRDLTLPKPWCFWIICDKGLLLNFLICQFHLPQKPPRPTVYGGYVLRSPQWISETLDNTKPMYTMLFPTGLATLQHSARVNLSRFYAWYWGRLEVGKFGAHVGCLGMGRPPSPGWEPPVSLSTPSSMGGNLLGLPSPG